MPLGTVKKSQTPPPYSHPQPVKQYKLLYVKFCCIFSFSSLRSFLFLNSYYMSFFSGIARSFLFYYNKCNPRICLFSLTDTGIAFVFSDKILYFAPLFSNCDLYFSHSCTISLFFYNASQNNNLIFSDSL